MRILYLHQYFSPPGASGNNRSYELAVQWVRMGHQVTILTSCAYFPSSHPTKPFLQRLEFDGVEVVALNVPYAHKMGFRRRLRAFLQFFLSGMKAAKDLERPDLIYASSSPLTVGEMGRRLSAKWKVPYVFETVDVWPDVPIGMGIIRNPLLVSWLHRRTNKIYDSASMVVALSEGMREQILNHGVEAQKVRVFHNGTNTDAFPFVRRQPKADVDVIYAGTVGVANGVASIVEVCKKIQDMGRADVRFTILGDGNDMDHVKSVAKHLEPKNLRIIPPVPKEEVAAILAEADIGLVTFAPFKVLEANSANKFYDYLSSGLPVVINYMGWQAGYLDRYNCGLYSEMGNSEAFLANILRLADDAGLRKRMGENGHKLAGEKFDRRQIAAELEREFRRILQ
jgi:glycosyltransferase involved in cell wall biosynthesis